MKFALKCLVLLAVALTPLAAQANTFLVQGRAPLTGNEAADKQKAVADALARAVAQRAAELVDPATLRSRLDVLDKKVLAEAKRFITNYSLLAAKPSGDDMLALVRVTLDEKALSQSLIKEALKLPTSHLGSVLVMVSEEAAPGRPPVYWWSGLPGIPAAPPPVAKVLKSLGVRMVNPGPLKAILTPDLRQPVLNEGHALELARQAKAKLLILGSVRTYPLVTPKYSNPSPVVQLMAIDTASGTGAAIVENEGPIYNSTPPPKANEAVLAAVEGAVRDLMAQIAANETVAAPAGARFTLNVTGVRSLAQLHRFEQVLSSMTELVSGYTRLAMGPGRAEFLLKLAAPASRLADQLLVADFGDFLVNVVEGSADNMEVVLIPNQPGVAQGQQPAQAFQALPSAGQKDSVSKDKQLDTGHGNSIVPDVKLKPRTDGKPQEEYALPGGIKINQKTGDKQGTNADKKQTLEFVLPGNIKVDEKTKGEKSSSHDVYR